MDYQAIQTFITSVGFPIAMCCVMSWYIKYQNEIHSEEIKEITDKFADEIQANHEAIEQNKQTLADIKAKLSEK